MTKVAIIILNWKQAKLTIETINSVLQINKKGIDYHIYLLDNNSQDDSIDEFEKNFSKNKKISIFNTGSNLGYTGNNWGIKKAIKSDNYDYILLLNNDVLVDKNFLYELIKKAKSNKTPSLVGPKIYFAPHYEYHKDRYKKNEIGNVIWFAGGKIDWNNIYGSNIGVDEVDKGQFDKKEIKLDFITGCCLLIDIKIINSIGLLDSKYFMYLEDMDYSRRAKLSGFDLLFAPKSKIWHVNSGSSGSGSKLHDYFITRNRLMFGYKYASLRTKFALFRESIKLLIIGRKYVKKGIIDYYTKNLGKGSWV
jgi:GT2 family glycosyltransferase